MGGFRNQWGYVCALLVTWAVVARADLATERRLLGQHLRPTITEIKKAFGAQPIMWTGSSVATDAQALAAAQSAAATANQNIWSDLPRVIAVMEQCYPGATWAALGRDSFNLSDLLDAFYQSLGQQNRVVRINASTSTVNSASAGQLVQMLEHQGLDLVNIDSRPPFILFDNTSFSHHPQRISQSTRIVREVFLKWRQMGKRAEDLITKFNLMTTQGGVDPDQTDILRFQQQQEQEARGGGMFQSILSMPGARGFMYGSEWHDPFGLLYLDANGQLNGTPGPIAKEAARASILAMLIQTIQIMEDPLFLEKVKQQALKLGYEFPLTRSERIPSISAEERERLYLESLRTSLEALADELPAKGEQTNYLSDNGKKYLAWLDSAMMAKPKNALCLLFIRNLFKARASEKIGERDLRRLIARAMGKMSVPDDTLLQKLHELYVENSQFRELLNLHRGVFTQSKRNDAAQVGAVFKYFEEGLKCHNIILAEGQGAE